MSKEKSKYQNEDGTFKEMHGPGDKHASAFGGCVLHMMNHEGHSEESAKKICGSIAAAVANDDLVYAETSGDGYNLALDNDAGIDDDGWALIAPFGEHPKTRLFRENGQVKEQKFIQVLDNESADKLVGKENSFFGKIKRALIGIPVFKGHGDLNDVDPKAVSNEKTKIKLGVVDAVRKAARGIEAHFALDNDGAEAVAAGWKFPSAFWYVLPNGTRLDAILARPFKLLSVALTPYPNISGVESLANARQQIAQSEHQQLTKEPDMKLIAGWLMAQGVALANAENPTETQVLEAFQKLHTKSSGDVVALGNEKSTLTGKITTLETESAAHKKRADETATALANEQSARKADRTAAATATVDLAIHKGILTVADRAAQIVALENSADFKKDSETLLAKTPIRKTTSNNSTESGKQTALNNDAANTMAEYKTAMEKEMPLSGQDPIKAHHSVMTKPEYSGLAEKLRPKTAVVH